MSRIPKNHSRIYKVHYRLKKKRPYNPSNSNFKLDFITFSIYCF